MDLLSFSEVLEILAMVVPVMIFTISLLLKVNKRLQDMEDDIDECLDELGLHISETEKDISLLKDKQRSNRSHIDKILFPDYHFKEFKKSD